MPELILTPTGPFSLEQTLAFTTGFAPFDAPQVGDGRLRRALVDDGGALVGLSARQEGDVVIVEYASDLPESQVAAHAARLLSLDVDASRWRLVGERDPVVGRLQRRYPGRRPTSFGTPFEAAAWSIATQRVRMEQAARVMRGIRVTHGETVTIDGVALRAFPAPERIAEIDGIPGLWPSKIERLRALAVDASAGALDAKALRALPLAESRSRLRELPGIGPFGADLVLARGVGHPDVPPGNEPRLLRAIAGAYGLLEDELAARLDDVATGWAPFRSWVAFLLRNAQSDDGAR